MPLRGMNNCSLAGYFHPINAKMFSIQMLQPFRQIVPRVFTLVFSFKRKWKYLHNITMLAVCVAVVFLNYSKFAILSIYCH